MAADILPVPVKRNIYRQTQCHILKIYLTNNECKVIFAPVIDKMPVCKSKIDIEYEKCYLIRRV